MGLGYINAVDSFLPNKPVSNLEIEDVLGRVNGEDSWARDVVLESCGMTSRHYALNPKTGESTHTNAQMSAYAVERASAQLGLKPADLDLLASGTATPDQLNPGHAPMTQGELASGPLEAVSFTGFCASGMAALRYAGMSVSTGMRKRAAVTGSELSSGLLRGSRFKVQSYDLTADELRANPVLSMNKEFLRWIAADGAGCAIVEAEPRLDRLSLKIDWIEGVSLAHEFPACMYHGAEKDRRTGRLRGWMHEPDLDVAVERNFFCISQDVALLKRSVISAGVEKVLADLVGERSLCPENYDWFLPHLSSFYFREPLAAAMDRIGFTIPDERWFTNLDKVGNLGSAAIYLILDEALKTGRFERGQKILCGVPESGRFTYFYMQLTVC